MQLGRKIYYNKTNGDVIWDRGELQGDVRETTFEEDKQIMPILKEIEPTQLGIKQLEYGEFANNFKSFKGYKVNTQTGELEFVQ